MTQEKIFSCCCKYLIDALTYEEYHSMGVEGFHKYVKEHIIPIPKSELVVGEEYPGYCKDTNKATWMGNVFCYKRKKSGGEVLETIKHYEDGYTNVFVPVKEI